MKEELKQKLKYRKELRKHIKYLEVLARDLMIRKQPWDDFKMGIEVWKEKLRKLNEEIRALQKNRWFGLGK